MKSTIEMLLYNPVVRQSGMYVLSMVLGRISQFLSIFLFSYFITPNDFGFYSIFSSCIWILASLISLNLYLGIGRYLYEPDIDNDQMMSTVLVQLAVASMLVAVGSAIWTYRGGGEWSWTVWLCLLVVALGFIFEAIVTQVAAYQQDGAFLLRASIMRAIGSVAVTMGLLLWSPGSKGLALVFGDVAGAVLLIAYFFIRGRFRLRWTISWHYMRQMAGYALPLTPYMLSLTLLTQLSRIIIDSYDGQEAAGLFSLSYNFGMLPLLAVTALTNALNRQFFTDLRNGDYPALAQRSDLVLALSSLCFASLLAFGEVAAVLLLPPKYAAAFKIIPCTAYAGLCLAMFQIWVRVLAFRDKTTLVSVVALGGLGANIISNLLLVPRVGMIGAAWSAAFAYAAMALASVLIVRYREGIGTLDIGRSVAVLGLAAAPVATLALFDLSFTSRQTVLSIWFLTFGSYMMWPHIRGRWPTVITKKKLVR